MLKNKDGQAVTPPYVFKGIRHPDNIEQLWSDEELAAIGLTRELEPPAPVLPPVVRISDRQFAHALKKRGIITHDEAMDFVTVGILPQQLALIVAAIPDQEMREDAEMFLCGATEFVRSHPLVDYLGQQMNWSPDEITAFFNQASAL